MSISDVPQKERTFLYQFWLGLALAALTWALLGIGTAIA